MTSHAPADSSSRALDTDSLDLEEIWRSCDPKGSESRFRELLQTSEKLPNCDRTLQIEILTQIARAEGAQGSFESPILNLTRAGEMIETQRSSYRVSAKIRWLLEKGRLHMLQKTPSQARPLFAEAWALATHSGEDHLAVDVAMMIALIEPAKAQQDWLTRALQVAESSSQPKARRFLGNLYASIGWKHFDLRQYDQALDIFQKSLKHFELCGTAHEVFLAKWSMGKLLRTMGKTGEALAIQQALLTELSIDGAPSGRLYEEFAECLHGLKRQEEAQTYFELAYRALSTDEWIVDNQPALLKRLKELGKVK